MIVPTTLIELRETGLTVRDPDQDIRGRRAIDAGGEDIGRIDALLVTSDEHELRMLRVHHGGILGFGGRSSFLPVEAITEITDQGVRMAQSGERIRNAPVYDPKLAEVDEYYGVLYAYYGYPGMWGLPIVPPPRDARRD